MKRRVNALVDFLFWSFKDDFKKNSLETKQLYGVEAILLCLALTHHFTWRWLPSWFVIAEGIFWGVVMVLFLYLSRRKQRH